MICKSQKCAHKFGGPNQGPILGSHITLCLEMSKCQNDKMAKWPNVTIEGVNVPQSYYKAYGTTCPLYAKSKFFNSSAYMYLVVFYVGEYVWV
jgi:hypothetical protein